MLDMERMPRHVAVIMDGNGRWAAQKGVPRLVGHNAGMEAMKEIVRRASDLGIGYLTVYAFSTENWKRSEEEVSGIFRLLVKFVKLDLDELNAENVKVCALGDWHVIPPAARKSLEKTLEETKDNTGLQFNIALNYGSRAEIVRAVNRIVADQQSGRGFGGDAGAAKSSSASEATDAAAGGATGADAREAAGEITEEMISRYLYTGDENGNIPDPDLIIRTSGEERLSNFLLWQSAYSEFVFTDTLWPDFSPEKFEEMIEIYQSRDRRFGGRK